MKTMKYLVPALMLFAGVACTKEIAAPEQDNVQEEATEQLELSASLSDVRTSLSGFKTLWSKDDEIAVRKKWSDGSTSRWYKFTAALTEDPASATFAGIIATGENYTLEAVYPYESALASGDKAINLIIPSEQAAKAGSFGEKAAVAVGECLEVNGKALIFTNVGSAMKFKLVHDASSVVITSTSDGAPVAGKFSYSGGKLTKLSDAVSSVTVSGEMKAGETYYAIVAPGTYKISAAISGEKVKESSAEIEFEANVINNLGIIADVNQIPNCYIVKPGTKVQIPVYKAFAMWEKSAWGNNYKPSAENLATVVQVLWEDEKGLLTNIIGDNKDQLPVSSESKAIERFFTVEAAGGKTGNAVVSIRFDGELRWPIHIWVTDYAGSSYQASNGMEFMDRNLGATSTNVTEPASYGVYYQACRPNPFPGPESNNSAAAMRKIYVPSGAEVTVTKGEIWGNDQGQSIRRAIKDPLLFVTSGSEPYSWITTDAGATDSAAEFWPSRQTGGVKTAYDPCPEGWMLPTYGDTSPFASLSNYSSAVHGNIAKSGRLKFNGQFDAGGSATMLWCGDATGPKTCALYMSWDSSNNPKEVNPDTNYSRGNALPVRCVKETF